MNISQEVREKIQLLSPGERIKHYLEMLTEKKITHADYANILKAIKSIPYTPTNQTAGEVCADNGQQKAVDYGRSEGDNRGSESDGTLSQESFVAEMERDDSLLLSRRTDVGVRADATTHPDTKKGKSQKAISPFYGG